MSLWCLQLAKLSHETFGNVAETQSQTNTKINWKFISGILQRRIELDKEVLFQFTQLKKEIKLMGGKSDPSVAPLLMRFQRGCQQVREEFCLIRPPRVQRWVWTFQIDRWVAIWGGKSDLQSGSQSSGSGRSKSQQKRGCATFFEVIMAHAGLLSLDPSCTWLVWGLWKKPLGNWHLSK